MQKLRLSGGDWELSYNGIETKEPGSEWLPAQVPGDVHLDLMKAGLIEEPLVADHSKACVWMEEKMWWYRKRFIVAPSLITDKVELVFEGLDTTADIWLNGFPVGAANNMFVTHRFDVRSALRTGENELLVRIDHGLPAVADKPVEPFKKAWNGEELKRMWMRKAQFVFSWDWAPRLVTCGIWRDVYVESYSAAAIRDVYATSRMEADTAVVDVSVELEHFGAAPEELTLSAVMQDRHVTLTRCITVEAGDRAAVVRFELEQPRLWWPNGMGEPHLYEMTVELRNRQGLVLDERTWKHGIRRVELLQEPLNEKEKTFTFAVNGKKLFAKGANWVPADSIPARVTDDKIRKLVRLAQEANFNMLRVWGGGYYEARSFYEACDEMGILVWHDFMYACGYYPDHDPAFCEEAVREAEHIVKSLRNHPCMAIWTGNNENHTMYHGQRQSDPDLVFYGQKLFDELLAEVCAKLIADTIYRPSSPYGGDRPNSYDEGDQHVWEYSLGVKWDSPKALMFWDYTEYNHKFMSEFGIIGPANVSTVKAYMGGHPIDRGGDVWKHHTNTFDLNTIDRMIDMYYRDHRELSFEKYTLAGQMVQAEALKAIIEEFRCRKYVCSGTLVWMYNDSWGTSGWTPVDYYLALKPLYYYMKRMYAPLHVLFSRDGRHVYVDNDRPEPKRVTVEYGVMTFLGERLAQRTADLWVPALSRETAGSLEEELAAMSGQYPEAFVYATMYDQQSGDPIDSNRSFLELPGKLQLPQTAVRRNAVSIGEGLWEVELSSESFAWMVVLEAEDAEFSDNAFDLWPGESKRVLVKTRDNRRTLELTASWLND